MSKDFQDPFGVGDYFVEPRLNRISKGSEHIAVRPRAMDLLVHLAVRGGAVVDTDEIIEKVWGGLFVTSGAIYNCVNELRHAFGDDKTQPAYIETIPKRGYRLIASVTTSAQIDQEAESLTSPRAAGDETGAAGHGLVIGIDRRRMLAAAAVMAAVILAVIYWLPGTDTPPLRDGSGRPSLAVLPFVNMSEEPGNEYFSDGISEEIISALVQNGELDVIGRTSSFAFKNKPQDLRDIGATLGTGYIVEGSVRRAGDRVRVTAQLVEAANGVQLWSATYDRRLSDIFAVQDEIARAIVGALEIELIGQDSRRLTDRGPIDPEAYQAYLRGRYFWNRRTPEAELKAIEYFERAIEIDPGYAAAYHGLADAHLLLLVTGQDPMSFADRFALGKAANERALELDPGFGPAYSTQAFVNLLRFRLDEILPNAEKAIALAPNYATAHSWMAVQTGFLGYPASALPIMLRAVALDPLSIVINLSYGNALFEAGQHAEAIAQYKEAITLAPDFERAWFSLGMAYLQLGRFEKARGVAGDIENAEGAAAFGAWIDLIEGKTALAEDDPEVDRLIAESEFRLSRIIGLLVLAGFHDRAIGYFEESAAAGFNLMIPLRIGGDPAVRLLFDKPRFQDFLRQVGFVDYWRQNGWPEGCRALENEDFQCD